MAKSTTGDWAAEDSGLTSAELQLIAASNNFSFALWSKVSGRQRDENIFISPLSASFALGMTLNGAVNQTFDQMRTALSVAGVSQQDINAGYKSLIALLTSLDPSVTMRIANSIWYRRGFPRQSVVPRCDAIVLRRRGAGTGFHRCVSVARYDQRLGE
jgi:serpin B